MAEASQMAGAQKMAEAPETTGGYSDDLETAKAAQTADAADTAGVPGFQFGCTMCSFFQRMVIFTANLSSTVVIQYFLSTSTPPPVSLTHLYRNKGTLKLGP